MMRLRMSGAAVVRREMGGAHVAGVLVFVPLLSLFRGIGVRARRMLLVLVRHDWSIGLPGDGGTGGCGFGVLGGLRDGTIRAQSRVLSRDVMVVLQDVS